MANDGTSEFPPALTGQPLAILRAEGLALFAASLFAYSQLDGSWLLLAALFLAPDLLMLGYLANPRVGPALYNVAHTTILPLMTAVGAVLMGSTLALSLSLIWIAHIGFDRMLGYGLKYPNAFGDTHLGRKQTAAK